MEEITTASQTINPTAKIKLGTRKKNSLAATNPACFHQDGIVPIAINDHVSLTHGSEICNSLETKLDKRRHSGRTSRIYKYIWNQSVFWITTMMMVLMAPILVQASPPQWQKCCFHRTDGSLINHTLTIKDTNCTFKLEMVLSRHNCSQLGFWFTAKNETYVEMWTTDLSTEDWIMEYGHGYRGEPLPAGGCEKVNKPSDKDPEPPDGSARPQLDGDSTQTVWIVGAVLGVLGVFGLVVFLALLYKHWQTFKRWVDTVAPCCRRHSKTSATQNGANTDHNPSAIPLMPIPSTNGDINRPPDEERPE